MIDLVQKRQHRAEKTAWLLQLVPFIKFIGLTGSLAYDMAKESSDIDIFIISQDKRIWTSRFFVFLLLSMAGILRKDESSKLRAGKICPNRFVTEKYLIINPQNRYHAQDYSQMKPLYDCNGMYQRFLEANKWMQKFGYTPPKRAIALVQSGGILSRIRDIVEWVLSGPLGDSFEDWSRSYQVKTIKKIPQFNKFDSGIYVDDNEIRIHTHPR